MYRRTIIDKAVTAIDSVAELLFDYLYNVLYNPLKAELDIDMLPDEFQDFGKGLKFFVQNVIEAKSFATELSQGNLDADTPSRNNEIASPLKSLQSALKHMTWQTQQVAKGDYGQRMVFFGAFSAAFNSMTEQLEKRTAQETKERKQLHHYMNLILENIPDIVLVFDTSSEAVLVSQAYMQISSLSFEDDIRGKTFTDLFAPVSTDDFLSKMRGLFVDAIVDRQMFEMEQSVDIKQDGNLRTYSIQVTPMFNEYDTVVGTMVVFHDMTEVIQAREDAERARELSEQSTKAKSDFLARMSHEMRTPMNAIIGMTNIGKGTKDIEKKDNSFREIENASAHLLGVINDVLDMSKIEADKLELSYNEFEFRKMLGNVNNIFKNRFIEKKQNFTMHIDDSIPKKIISDEQRLSQVIINLLSNAIKFTPNGGDITLTALKTTENYNSCEIRFLVKDTGIGISKEHQSHLFTPFEQGDGSISRKYGGSGLGLAISKNIAEKLQGCITVESEPGIGSTFIFNANVQYGRGKKQIEMRQDSTISISCVTDLHESSVETAKAQDPEGDDVMPNFQGHAVLLAEDVPINSQILMALLEPTKLEIECAENGSEALRMFSENPGKYSLIFMDIQMPVMDGYEATKKIRLLDSPYSKDIPIIAMTANVFREDIEKCLDAGMNGHLGKPIEIDEIIFTLKKYLAQRIIS